MRGAEQGAPVPWLSEDEQQAWRHILRGNRLFIDALEADLQGVGLRLSEYEILSMLSEAPGRRLRMSALAAMVVQSRSRVTHTAERLEKLGWVERRNTRLDRRGKELRLTDAGREVLVRVAPLHVASVRQHLLDQFSTAQLLELGAVMARVATAATPEEPPLPTGP